ncbi:type II toxin-antitoxin system VapB family antitoxin [Nocardia amikacinitolerans]|uniref:type II toxin-antitoxin system VapB family antitoxin n=1 Tax=Nocardia amikacinitolerans TaxID=756689 RepID=UPI0020A497EA|nr:type II toxin-antitoxin system VapB family antitoxin [Nocardia amikacinitolerans]
MTYIEIDDDALALAMTLGGHRTKAAAVAAALTEYNKRLSRAAACDHYFELARERSEPDADGTPPSPHLSFAGAGEAPPDFAATSQEALRRELGCHW